MDESEDERRGQGAILRLEHINKSFGAAKILQDFSIEIKKGEFVTFLGPSGCGKTTTLRIIAGLEKIDGGSIYLNGADITDLDANRRNVNTVFQNYALFPHMNVYDNISYGPRVKKTDKKTIRKKVNEMLALVRMEGYEKRMPGQLSGGQRQRVAIARALINEPDIALLDEPLGALDLALRRHMQSELKQIQKKTGITFIYVTHDQEEALNMSDRIALLNGGRIEQYGEPREIYDRPATLFAAEFVGERNIFTDNDVTYAVHTDKTLIFTDITQINADDCAPPAPVAVVDAAFAGAQTKITVMTDGGRELKAVEYNSERKISSGDKVFVTWKKTDAVKIGK